jgi:hypothetical protein
MGMNAFGYWTFAISAALAGVTAAPSQTDNPTAAEIRGIAASAYTFAYPLALMDVTRRTDLERRAHTGLPGANHFVHAQAGLERNLAAAC